MPSAYRYLLLVACSQRKLPNLDLLPAIDRYDGGVFRILRKARKEGNWPRNLDLLILSAKYGLIEDSSLIANYEQRMNGKRALELRDDVVAAIQSKAVHDQYSEVYVDLGQDYRPAIDGVSKIFSSGSTKVILAQGRIGERLARLKNWLIEKYEESQ